MRTETALAMVPVEQMCGVDIFNSMPSILDKIKQDARGEAANLDISTKKNREAIASLAYKVARSKTFIDEQGKKLVEDQKRAVSLIDADRKKAREELDDLKDEIRKPLTDWENAEKDRIAGHESAIAAIKAASALSGPLNLDEIEGKIASVKQMAQRDWQEFDRPAAYTYNVALADLETAMDRAKAAIAEREEIERLRAEAAERAIRQREEGAAKAAKESAERAAKAQAEAVAKSAEQARQRIEREKFEAEARAKAAEAARVAAIEQAKRDAEAAERRAIEAEQRAERDRVAAIENERQRVADEARRVLAETEARERNKAHRAKINREAKTAIMALGIVEAEAEMVIVAIAKNMIPNVAIGY